MHPVIGQLMVWPTESFRYLLAFRESFESAHISRPDLSKLNLAECWIQLNWTVNLDANVEEMNYDSATLRIVTTFQLGVGESTELGLKGTQQAAYLHTTCRIGSSKQTKTLVGGDEKCLSSARPTFTYWPGRNQLESARGSQQLGGDRAESDIESDRCLFVCLQAQPAEHNYTIRKTSTSTHLGNHRAAVATFTSDGEKDTLVSCSSRVSIRNWMLSVVSSHTICILARGFIMLNSLRVSW